MRDTAELSDVQSESGIIGTLLRHPEYMAFSEHLSPKYFYGHENASIYWAIRKLYNDGVVNIDAFNLANTIKSDKKVSDKIDEYNMPTIQEWIDLYSVNARSTIEEYRLLVDQVVTLAFKRDMVRTLENIENDCYKNDVDLEKLNNSVYRSLDDLTQKYIVANDVQTLGSQIDDIWAEIVSRRTEDGIYGIPSKYPSFNDYFTYEPGEMVVVQAYYKRGKSVFLMNEVVHKLKMGVACLVVDSEMPTRLYTERLLSHLTGIEVRRIKTGNYNADEEQTIKSCLAWIKKQPFIHVYDPNMTMEKLYSICKMQKRTMNLGFVVYDYLKSNATSSSDNYNILGAMCDFLKNNIAGELDLPVLAACQLNRQGEVADSIKINRYLSVGIKWEFKTQEMIISDGERCGNAYAKIYLNRLGRQMDESDDSQYIDFTFSGDNMTIVEAPSHNTVSAF